MNAAEREQEKVGRRDGDETPVAETVTVVEFESTSPAPDQSESAIPTNDKVRVEEFKISGDDLVGKVRELIHQGNIRRIIVKNEEGRILVEVPLTVGVVGGVVGATLFPIVAALGAIGALVAHLSVVIERSE